MTISKGSSLPRLDDYRHDSLHYDVVVVGGGPAGIAAALESDRQGLRTAILEEHHELGGQYYKRRGAGVLAQHGDYRPEGTHIIEEIRSSGVDCLTDRTVWGVGDDGRSLLTTSVTRPDQVVVTADAIIVATGAFEAMAPFPGWELPGIVSAGYALHLATCDVVPLASRVVVAGTGPFLLQVACSLLDVGVDVQAVVEANTPYRPKIRSSVAIRHPTRLRELGFYWVKLKRHGVKVRQGWAVQEVTTTNTPQLRVRLMRQSKTGPSGAAVVLETDAVAIGYGFRPSTEIARLLGCSVRIDGTTGDLVPVVDENGRSSVDGVYIVGEAAGIAGVYAASVRGQVAGAAASEGLGRRTSPTDLPRLKSKQRKLDKFARLTAKLYPFPWGLIESLADATIVCRCEAVTAGQIRDAAALSWNDQNAIKGSTRAGMGPCQGRECALSVRCLSSSDPMDQTAAFTARMPIKPISVSSFLEPSKDEGEAQ